MWQRHREWLQASRKALEQEEDWRRSTAAATMAALRERNDELRALLESAAANPGTGSRNSVSDETLRLQAEADAAAALSVQRAAELAELKLEYAENAALLAQPQSDSWRSLFELGDGRGGGGGGGDSFETAPETDPAAVAAAVHAVGGTTAEAMRPVLGMVSSSAELQEPTARSSR